MSTSYRWRKATDINRRFATFELLADEKFIVDVGYSDTGIFEVAFNKEIGGLVFEWAQLQELIEAGRKMAEIDQRRDSE